VADEGYDDDQLGVEALVDHTVALEADPVEVLLAAQLLAARRARVLGQGVDPGYQPPLDVPRKLPKAALGRSIEPNAIGQAFSGPAWP
jgi:hypothetical protein